MNSKTLNIVMLVASILFCLIFGLSGYLRLKELQRLDELHDKEVQESENKANDELLSDATITQNNNNNISNNNNTNTVIKDTETGEEINFTDFASVYNYAERKINNSTNLYIKATGNSIVSGSTNFGGYSLSNETLNIEFVRAINPNQKWLGFQIRGYVQNLGELNHITNVYNEGALSYIYTNENQKWLSISNTSVKEKFGCDFNQTFQTINADTLKNSTILKQNDGTYLGIADLDCTKSSVKASRFMHGALGADNDANYKSCHLTVTFDVNGRFKAIRYQESFDINLTTTVNGKKIVIYATINADYTENFVYGTPTINRPNI